VTLVRASYMVWAKQHARARWDLTGSNLLPCAVADLPGAREAIELAGDNDNGYQPLVEAIASRYRVAPEQVATANGASGANFLVFAALVGPGDEVLVERPGYDPLLAAPQMLGARIVRFDRRHEDGYRLDPSAVSAALTSRTRLIVLTNAHNPTGVVASASELDSLARIAERAGVPVLVDEVYLDTVRDADARPAVSRSPVFISTGSLTKSYGLSGLRCGWVLGATDVAERVRRARDVVDGTGPFPTERIATLAFAELDRLLARARAILEPNRAMIRDFLENRPELDAADPVGGTVAFPRLRGADDADPFVTRLFDRYETGVVPGRFFDAPAHFRIAFGGPAETLAGGLARIGEALGSDGHRPKAAGEPPAPLAGT
jgi:aspartate/methionine/tyrosine aminotransferase